VFNIPPFCCTNASRERRHSSMHKARNTLCYLQRENIQFIEPDMWPPSLDLINTKIYFCSSFGCWLLSEKFSFCPIKDGFARVSGAAAPPGSYAYGEDNSRFVSVLYNGLLYIELYFNQLTYLKITMGG